jgi:hypothetical protein
MTTNPDMSDIQRIQSEIACIRSESYKRLANIEGEITFISKVIERLDDALPIIITNDANLKTIKEKQDNCPANSNCAALKTRVESLEHYSNLYKYLWIGTIGFISYLEKQLIWQVLQRVFT